MAFLISLAICILLQFLFFIPFWKIWKEDCKEHGKENLAVPLPKRFMAWLVAFPIWAIPFACAVEVFK